MFGFELHEDYEKTQHGNNERDDEVGNKKTHQSECMIMVNGSTNYGSLTSLVSPEDVGLGTSQRRRKKFSVSSMMSSFSNTSDQPYLSLMSNLGERKLSSLSACGSVITKQSSEESVVSKTSSDNKYPVSNKKEVGAS